MTFAIRALSLCLTVWLTAVAAFPACCWSMSSTHDHQARQEAAASPLPSHDHHHHTSTDSAPPAAAPVMSAVPVHDCDTASVEAVTTPRTPLSFVDLSASNGPANPVTTQTSARLVFPSTLAPPGASSASAFLNPLRV